MEQPQRRRGPAAPGPHGWPGWQDLPPEAFAAELRARGVRRAWLAPDASRAASHPHLEGVARDLARDPAWDGHEAVFLAVGPETGALLSATLHCTTRGQAQGGLRHWRYPRVLDFLRDGLRLSRAMSRKNALAGLWWGGGKGGIARGARADDPAFRRALYREYGRFVTSLRGAYVTAEDAGTRPEDMAEVAACTRFATCVPVAMGGSGNPSPATARGVLLGMDAALAFAGLGGIAGRSVAMQGLGNVGAAMLEGLLLAGASRVVASDLDPERVAALRRRLVALGGGAQQRASLRVTAPEDVGILAEPCDVLAPNALGGVLSPQTIPKLRARVVCGAANAPLAEGARDAAALAARGVLYVPSFVVNRMGIVQCANEQYGSPRPDPAVERHLDPDAPDGIRRTTLRVLERARAEGTTPLAAAEALADERLREPHPIWGDRGRALVRSLLEGEWAGAVGPA